jgi:hypothetical protein
MSVQSLPDGILVSLHTSVTGGVQYQRRDLDAAAHVNGAAAVSRWETTKLVEDPDELARAQAARSAATHAVRRVCVATSFGLLCRADRAAELEQAIADARTLVDAHNREARHSRVELRVLCGRVSGSDPETIRAIAAELSGVLTELAQASDALDVARMREAASGALRLTALLPSDLARQVEQTVADARATARALKRGEAGVTTAPIVSAIRRIRIAQPEQSGQ